MELEILPRARMLPGARLIKESPESEVWLGEVLTDTEAHRAYVKLGPAVRNVADAACALIGRAGGLPIPRPYLVQVDRETLPESRQFPTRSDHVIATALQAMEMSMFAQAFRHDANRAWKMIAAWPQAPAAGTFDEWSANPDRQLTNILYSPGQGFWLIDHGNAFGGERWDVMGLPDTDAAFTNILVDNILTGGDTARAQAYLQKCIEAQHHFSSISLASLTDRLGGPDVWTGLDLTQLRNFLTLRLTAVISLLSARLGIPDLGFPS